MSFANLKSTRGSSIDKLVQAAEAVSKKQKPSHTLTIVSGNPLKIKLVMVMLLLDFFLQRKVRIYLGFDIGTMALKARMVYGISKTRLLLSTNQILFQK